MHFRLTSKYHTLGKMRTYMVLVHICIEKCFADDVDKSLHVDQLQCVNSHICKVFTLVVGRIPSDAAR